MKRQREVIKDIHRTEPCDEWLSTRNKHKIKPPSPKPQRRRSGVYKGFPRQPSSNLWHLTQSAPPHPLLLKATKQSSIQGFFKRATKTVSPSSFTSKSVENENGHISSLRGGYFETGDLEFDPQEFSTQKLDENVSPESINCKIGKSYDSRENTLEDSCVLYDPCDNTAVEYPSTVGDSQYNIKSDGRRREKMKSNQGYEKFFSSDLCIVDDSCLSDNENDLDKLSLKELDKLSLRRKRKTSQLKDSKLDNTDLESGFSSTGDDDLDEISLRRSKDNFAFSTDLLGTQSEYAVNNSLIFTQTETNTPTRNKRENIDINDDSTDSFEEIMKKVRQRRKKVADGRPKGDMKVRIDESLVTNEESRRKASSKESNSELRKTGPFTLYADHESENFEPSPKRSRRDMVQDRSLMEHTDRQTDSYLQTSEQSRSQLSLSDTVSTCHLAPLGNNPTGKPQTRAFEHRRPCWITRSAVNENISKDKSAMKTKTEDVVRKSADVDFIHGDENDAERICLNDNDFNIMDRNYRKNYRNLDFRHNVVDENINEVRKGSKNNFVNEKNGNDHIQSTELDFLYDTNTTFTNKEKLSQGVENSLQFTETQGSQTKTIKQNRLKKYGIEGDISLSFD